MRACVVVVVSILVDFLSAHTYVLTGHQPIPRKRHIVRHAAHYLLGSWTVTSHFPAKVCIPGSFFFLFFMPFVLKDIPSLFVWMVEALKSAESSRVESRGGRRLLHQPPRHHPSTKRRRRPTTDRPTMMMMMNNKCKRRNPSLLLFLYSCLLSGHRKLEEEEEEETFDLNSTTMAMTSPQWFI